MKKKIKIITSLSLIGVLTAGAIIPIVTLSLNNNVKVNQKLSFDGQTFDSKADLIKYANESAEINTSTIRERNRWSIEENGEKIFFDDINNLRRTISDQKISTYSAASSNDIKLGANGEIYNNQLANMNIGLDKPVEDIHREKVDIFRGKNNSYFQKETEAKETYLEMHDAYYFDNIYFRTKEELASYLFQYFDDYRTDDDTNIVLKCPDGHISEVITNPNKLNITENEKANSERVIKNFVENHSKSYWELEHEVSNTQKFSYYDKEKINNTDDSGLLAKFNNPSRVRVTSNGGNSNYIVDLNKEDQNMLFGPYYAKTDASINQITDTKQWRKIEKKDLATISNFENVEILSNFINLIIGDTPTKLDIENKLDKIFYLSESVIQKEVDAYFINLKKQQPSIYESIRYTNESIYNGKRYSSFYKLPILYIKTIEEIINKGASQKLVEETKAIYKKIAEFYDSCIKRVIPDFFLKHRDESKDPFSFVDLFHLESVNFDLNSDIETFATLITDLKTTKYPNLFKFIQFFSYVFTLSNFTIDTFEYDISLIEQIFKFKGFGQLNLEGKKLENVWDLLTTTEIGKAKESIQKISASNKLNITTNEAIDHRIIQSILLNKTMAKTSIIKSIERELETIGELKSEVVGNYPDLTLFPKGSFFENASWKTLNKIYDLYINNDSKIDLKIFSKLKIIWNILGDDAFVYNLEIAKYPDMNTMLTDKIKKTIDKIDMSSLIDIYGQSALLYAADPTPKDGLLSEGWQDISNTADIIGEIAGFAGNLIEKFSLLKAIPNIGPIISAVQSGLSFVSDMFSVKIEEYAYIFESEDSKYIWDGGRTESTLFGFLSETIDIEDMKILDPIQITQSHLATGDYYNGKIYDSLNQLKIDQLYDIKNGNFISDKLKPVYSFAEGFNNQINLDTRPEHVKAIKKEISDAIIKNPGESSKNVYSYGNGYTFDSDLSKDKDIQDLVNKIRPVKIAMIPILVNNKPKYEEHSLEDDSVPDYQLPARSWTATSGFKYNTINHEYIIYDPNKKEAGAGETEIPIETEQEVIENVSGQFMNRFDIDSKSILKNDLYLNSNFSDYKNNIKEMKVYKAELKNGYKKFFLNESNAFSWLMTELEFTVYDALIEKKEYRYRTQIFNSLDEYLVWVFENTKEV